MPTLPNLPMPSQKTALPTSLPDAHKAVAETAPAVAPVEGDGYDKAVLSQPIPLHRSRLVLIPLLRAITINDTKGLRDPKGLLSPVAKLDLDLIGEEEVIDFINNFLTTELRRYLPKYDQDVASYSQPKPPVNG